MRASSRLGTALLFSCLAVPAPAAAEELRRTEPVVLVAELSGALALAGGAYLLPTKTECSWCEPNGFDEALHAPAAPENRPTASRVSHWLSSVVLPVGALGVALVPPFAGSEPDGHAPENTAIIAEAVFLDLALNLAIKSWVGRRRPAFHYGRGVYTEYADEPTEVNVSFFSSDSGVAFATASATATVAFLRGYAGAPYVAGAGAALAGSTALLRVRADVHWPSDVLVGSLVGVAVGILVPLALHGRDGPTESSVAALAVQPSRSPPALGLAGSF